MTRSPSVLIWGVVGVAVSIAIAFAVSSPLLVYRGPAYIAAGLAGVVALGLLIVQPLLIGLGLPGLSPRRERQLHRVVGTTVVLAVAMHVGGLYIASPPDVIDVLLLRSPTPFSLWGVAAMWAVVAVALLVAVRRPLRLSLRTWRLAHAALAVVIVIGTVVHALLIEGTMEWWSKVALCAAAVAATGWVMRATLLAGR
ncbi:MAG: ferric reductase-like transmembrane domain-containing protein [Pseudomonadota bacterium]